MIARVIFVIIVLVFPKKNYKRKIKFCSVGPDATMIISKWPLKCVAKIIIITWYKS